MIKLKSNLKKSPVDISSLQVVVFILSCVGVSIPWDLINSSSTSMSRKFSLIQLSVLHVENLLSTI